MANLNAPHGFRPTGGLLHSKMYKIADTYATALYIGDPVVRDASGDIVIATAGAGNYILGVALGFFDTSFAPLTHPYYVASTAGVHYCLVADHPEQYYEVQDDGTVTQLALVDLGALVNLILTHGGSTTTGLSGAEIDSSSQGTGATQQFRLMDIYRDVNNAIGANCRWQVKIAYLQGAPVAVGVGI